jgi:hypothetical protein
LVDDSSKFNRNRQAEQSSLNRGAPLSKGRDRGVGGQRNDKSPEPSTDLPETLELPVVARVPTVTTPLPAESISYHPPRKPPNSVAPPPPAATISVAPEYDPRAPTKPRVRRISSQPPEVLLFGLDRMLVWGMLLGGLFVAIVFILVHRLAPGASRDVHRNEVRPREPRNENAPLQSALPRNDSPAPLPSKALTTEAPSPAAALGSLPVPEENEQAAKPPKTRLPRKPRESKVPTELKEPPWIE